MSRNELEQFIAAWEHQADNVARTLESLPEPQYDFRPDPQGRSLGELGWHFAEIDGYMTWGIEQGGFAMGNRPAGLERPREVAALAPGYRRVHGDALERVRAWNPDALDRMVPFFDGRPLPARRILWDATLHHSIHHLGQLVLMCRIAGGTPPGLYGPNRETTVAMREAAAKRS